MSQTVYLFFMNKWKPMYIKCSYFDNMKNYLQYKCIIYRHEKWVPFIYKQGESVDKKLLAAHVQRKDVTGASQMYNTLAKMQLSIRQYLNILYHLMQYKWYKRSVNEAYVPNIFFCCRCLTELMVKGKFSNLIYYLEWLLYFKNRNPIYRWSVILKCVVTACVVNKPLCFRTHLKMGFVVLGLGCRDNVMVK